MPFETIYLEDEKGLVTTYWGKVTDSDIIESGMKKCESHERMRSYRYFIVDCTDVEEFNVTSTGIEINAQLALDLAKVNKDVLIAFVLTTELELSMGEMWQAYAVESGITSRLFRTRSEADAWIKDSLPGKRDKPETR